MTLGGRWASQLKARLFDTVRMLWGLAAARFRMGGVQGVATAAFPLRAGACYPRPAEDQVDIGKYIAFSRKF